MASLLAFVPMAAKAEETKAGRILVPYGEDSLTAIFKKKPEGGWDFDHAEVYEHGYKSDDVLNHSDLYDIIAYGSPPRRTNFLWIMNEGGEYPKTTQESLNLARKNKARLERA